MTDEETRCAILKYAYDAKKAGKVAMAVLDWVTTEYRLDAKRVLVILRSLRNENLIRSCLPGTATDIEITEKGIREYKEKCGGN